MLWMTTNPTVVAALASKSLPSLEDLTLVYNYDSDDDDDEDPPGGAPGLQLMAAAPWFPQLGSQEVRKYSQPPGDVSGAAAPKLSVFVWSPASRDDTSDAVAALGRVLAAASALSFVDLTLASASQTWALTRADFATLLAAPGLAGSLEELTLHTGVYDDEELVGDEHPLAALAAARLPALQNLVLTEDRGATRDFMAALGTAPWAPRLVYLRLLNTHGGPAGALLGYERDACAAVSALAAAPLVSLRTLDFDWALPLDAMLALVRAPWFGGLQRIGMAADEGERQALCAASPAYAALCARGGAY
jgi:hypothetical protein